MGIMFWLGLVLGDDDDCCVDKAEHSAEVPSSVAEI
jgi:hypothetical protein